MLNKNDIINIMQKYNFDKSKYIIISGAAMVLYGLKEFTKDIDIAVSDDLFEELLQKFPCEFEVEKKGKPIYFIDNIINFGQNYYTQNHYNIGDLPVQTIDHLIKLKKELNRKKDATDLNLILKYKNNI